MGRNNGKFKRIDLKNRIKEYNERIRFKNIIKENI